MGSPYTRGHASQGGFTLIELLVVLGIIAILAAIVIIAINPARQFAQARDSQRESNVEAILNAIGENIADNRGVFTCTSVLPSGTTVMSSSQYDIYTCIVPTYMPSLPYDPSAAGAHDTSATDYDTEYTVVQDTNGRVTICAPQAGSETAISATPPAVCVTR